MRILGEMFKCRMNVDELSDCMPKYVLVMRRETHASRGKAYHILFADDKQTLLKRTHRRDFLYARISPYILKTYYDRVKR
jgi:hypothetical protein